MSEAAGKRVGGAAAESSSPASSCVSSDAEDDRHEAAAKPMVVVGCPQCLMYVMLSGEEQQPKCPRCKSPVLLHLTSSAPTTTTPPPATPTKLASSPGPSS